jgi:hypothetical protein
MENMQDTETSVEEERGKRTSLEKNWDIVILCSPLVVDWIRKTFEEQIADQQLPASVIWAGPSYRYGQGVVVIEWEGEPSDHFVGQLEIDTEVIDYMLYEVPTVEGAELAASRG